MLGQPPVGGRRHLVLTKKIPVEVGDVDVANFEADIGDRRRRLGEQGAGLVEAQADIHLPAPFAPIRPCFAQQEEALLASAESLIMLVLSILLARLYIRLFYREVG